MSMTNDVPSKLLLLSIRSVLFTAAALQQLAAVHMHAKICRNDAVTQGKESLQKEKKSHPRIREGLAVREPEQKNW